MVCQLDACYRVRVYAMCMHANTRVSQGCRHRTRNTETYYLLRVLLHCALHIAHVVMTQLQCFFLDVLLPCRLQLLPRFLAQTAHRLFVLRPPTPIERAACHKICLSQNTRSHIQSQSGAITPIMFASGPRLSHFDVVQRLSHFDQHANRAFVARVAYRQK